MHTARGPRAIARRSFKFAALAICATLGLALASAPALAKTSSKKPKAPKVTTHTPVTPGSTYLALGDSVTFGYEEAQVVPAPNYADASSFVGYPELVGSALHLNVVNAACSGETSASLVNATAPSNGCENAPNGGAGYRTHFPLHVNYNGSQLGFAVSYLKKHHNVRLVSLMIGANDFFLCQETTADKCASFTEQAAVGATVSKNINTILSAIRNKAHYGGPDRDRQLLRAGLQQRRGGGTVPAPEHDPGQCGQAVPRDHRRRLRSARGRVRALRWQQLHRGAAHAALHRWLRNSSELRRPVAAGAGGREGDPPHVGGRSAAGR